MPSGSNAALILRHERELGRVLERKEMTALVGADAMLAGNRATERGAGGEDLPKQLLEALGVGLKHGQVHVAVAGVATPHDHRPALLRNYGHLCQKLGDLRARDHGVDDLTGAGCLGGEEGALACFDQVRRRTALGARTRQAPRGW